MCSVVFKMLTFIKTLVRRALNIMFLGVVNNTVKIVNCTCGSMVVGGIACRE